MKENRFISTSLMSRRRFFALTGAAVGSQFLPAFADSADTQSRTTPPSFTLFYKPEFTGNIWDTWTYYHKGTFYLYYNPSPSDLKTFGGWNGVALATSSDGVHWKEYGMVIDPVPDITYLGAGAVWPVGEKFIMNFSEMQRDSNGGIEKQTIFFAESRDLIHWRRLGSEYAFSPDTRWYESKGRWDNIWPVPRPEGGYYGYFAGWTKDNKAGIGFGESDDGVTWRALPPPALPEEVVLPWREKEINNTSPEVNSAYFRDGKYYILIGGDYTSTPTFPGITALVSDSASGPFRFPHKNPRPLVCNASYFLRFVDVGGDVLVNHHSWEVGDTLNPERVWMAPLKKAQWDDEGTLRLMWWEQNNLAKGETLSVSSGKSSTASQPSLLTTLFNPQETLILEGEMPLPSFNNVAPIGLYLQGSGDIGTAFLVRENGLVDYGSMRMDGGGFEKQGSVDRDLVFTNSVRFRLVRKGQLTEFYLNDYLMQCYSLPEQGTGHIGLIGPPHDFSKLKAWYCA